MVAWSGCFGPVAAKDNMVESMWWRSYLMATRKPWEGSLDPFKTCSDDLTSPC
jgi:hypothetical protein